MKKCWYMALGVVSWLALMTTPASAANATYTPSSVVPGGSVTITGTVPVAVGECPVPGNVILQTEGLLANGAAFVAVPYDAAGHFSANVTLSSTIALGPYGFGIRCAGRKEPLGPVAGGEVGGPFPTFTVIGLAHTGGSVGPVQDAAVAAIGLGLVVIGVLLVFGSRSWAGGFSVGR